MRRILIFLVALLIGGAAAQAQTFPPLSGRVVDAANLLSPAQTAQLTQLSEQIEQASTRQFVVATVPDLQGYPIEDYGYKLGRTWGIGQKDSRNGIILLVAPKERKVRIEVGYGLEPIMTDALSSTIIADTILPKFRGGDMPGGIIDGANAIGEQMKLPLEAAEARAAKAMPPPKRKSNGGNGAALIFWGVILVFFILPMLFRRRGGQRYRGGIAPVILWGSGLGGGGGSSWGGGGGSDWGGGGGGGGFSGGGGSFGGGGASGGW